MTSLVPSGQSPTTNDRVVPGVGPWIEPTSRQERPRAVLATTRIASLGPRARPWAQKRSLRMAPGAATGKVKVPTPPFHQQEPSRTSRLLNEAPIVAVVSFLANEASGVIRQAIVRVAIAG